MPATPRPPKSFLDLPHETRQEILIYTLIDEEGLNYFVKKYESSCRKYPESMSNLFSWQKHGIDNINADTAKQAHQLRRVHPGIGGDVDFVEGKWRGGLMLLWSIRTVVSSIHACSSLSVDNNSRIFGSLLSSRSSYQVIMLAECLCCAAKKGRAPTYFGEDSRLRYSA